MPQKGHGRTPTGQLQPWILQILGATILVVFCALWWIKEEEPSPVLVGAALALAIGGEFIRVQIGQRRQDDRAVREAIEAYEAAREEAGAARRRAEQGGDE